MKDLNYKMKLSKVDANSADERRKPVIEDVIEKNGRLPNMYAYMINSPEYWKLTYTATNGLEKKVVLLLQSRK